MKNKLLAVVNVLRGQPTIYRVNWVGQIVLAKGTNNLLVVETSAVPVEDNNE